MQTALFNIIDGGDGDQFPEIQTHLSFEPFLNYLKKRLENELSIKKDFFESIQNDINLALEKHGPLNDQNIFEFEQEFKLIHASLNPPLADEEESYWAIGFPMGQKICFSTDQFYKLLQHHKCQIQPTLASSADHTLAGFSEKTRMLYSFIMERLYGLNSSRDFELIHSFVDASGLQKYYRINIDHSFVDVKVIVDLPPFDRLKVRGEFSKTLDPRVIKTLLPLDKIRLEGFSILTVNDITSRQALDNIKNIIIKGNGVHDSYQQVMAALKTLAGVQEIEFSLLAFLKLNNKVVFDFSKGNTSALYTLLRSNQVDDAHIQELVGQFQERPEILIFSKDESNEGNNITSLFNGLADLGIEDYALIPVFYNKEVVGVIEVFTKKKDVLDDQVLSRVFSASTLLAQLLKDEIIEFAAKLNEVIKEKFTSIQPAVQWKFNDIAWEYLQSLEEGKPKPHIGDIKFENVYPLYGAIDIRNSTIERNRAVFQDMIVHLELLEKTLVQLRSLVNIAILDEMVFNCKRWLKEINEESMDHFQIQLTDFLNRDVTDILTYFRENSQESYSIIDNYERAIDPIEGIVHKNKKALEESLQLINTGINGYLELFHSELQSSYPFYFEKFRSDGVEYDIYIGQSIAPNNNYNEVYLKNIRLWQLTSMASIAKITNSLLDQMEKRLLTTQLIFVNAAPIDISFRTDERRFDVEGAYNIRYQIIKKRIDKVTLKDSAERLTQPGKIALVYFTEKEIKEYLGYILYLQKDGTLLDDLEVLELEELQGVKGLRALRVGVFLAK